MTGRRCRTRRRERCSNAYQSRDITYLNNRHYNPTTGVFVSVDPLVTKTGQPYIYGSANPVTYSDPDGLDPDTRADVRAEAERRGGCTYSSTIEACQGKGPRRGPTQWSTPTPAGPYFPTAVAREDYDPDLTSQGIAKLGIHPHRPISVHRGSVYIGGYRDRSCDFRCAMEVLAAQQGRGQSDFLDAPTVGTAWGTKAAGITNVAWGGYKVYQGTSMMVASPALGPAAPAVFVIGGWKTGSGSFKIWKGWNQVFDERRCYDCGAGDHFQDYWNGMRPSGPMDWLASFW